jgi:hypothetical protein
MILVLSVMSQLTSIDEPRTFHNEIILSFISDQFHIVINHCSLLSILTYFKGINIFSDVSHIDTVAALHTNAIFSLRRTIVLNHSVAFDEEAIETIVQL